MIVQVISLAGWLEWRRARRVLELEPQRGAVRLAESALVALPSTVHWTLNLAGQHVREADRDTASAALERIGRLQCLWFPTDPAGPKNLGQGADLRDRRSEALGWMRLARERGPTSPYLAQVTALFEIKDGQYEQALDLLADAQALAPGYDRPHVDVLPGDDVWLRLEGLRRRARLFPGRRVRVLVELAGALRDRGRAGEAADIMETVREEPEAKLELARWALDEERPEDAVREARVVAGKRTLPASLRAQAYALMAEARGMMGHEEAARRWAHEALRLSPNSPRPYLAISAVAERRDDLEEALRHARSAWGVAPTNISVLLRVSRLAERTERGADARLALERAIELAPDRSDLRARHADLLLRQGRYMEAAVALSRALDRFPTDARLLRLAGRLRAETGRRGRR